MQSRPRASRAGFDHARLGFCEPPHKRPAADSRHRRPKWPGQASCDESLLIVWADRCANCGE